MSAQPFPATDAVPASLPLPKGMLVVDDHDLVRLGLRSLVQSHAAEHQQSITVLESRCLAEALQLYATMRRPSAWCCWTCTCPTRTV